MRNAKQTPAWARPFILALTTLALVACGGPAMDDQQLVQTAKTYIAENKMREAALELKNALQANPDNAEARYLLGQINLDVGDMAGAEKEFRRAASAGWKEEEARIGVARALISSHTFQKVVDEVEIKDSYPASARADLYGLGVVAYQMLTGELPFKQHNPGALLIAHLTQPPPDPRELVASVPEGFAKLVLRLMEKAPEDRYESAAEVGEELQAIANQIVNAKRR